jgi:hypothetical protein
MLNDFNTESLVTIEQLQLLRKNYDCASYTSNHNLAMIVTAINAQDDMIAISYCDGTIHNKPSVNQPFSENPNLSITYTRRGLSKIQQIINKFVFFFEQEFGSVFNPHVSYKSTSILLNNEVVKVRVLCLELSYNSMATIYKDLKKELITYRDTAWEVFYFYLQDLLTKDFIKTFLYLESSYNDRFVPHTLYKDIDKTLISATDKHIRELYACEGYNVLFGSRFLKIPIYKTRTALCVSVATEDYYVLCYSMRKKTCDYFGIIPNKYGRQVDQSFQFAVSNLNQLLEINQEQDITEWPVYFGIET